MKVNPNPPLLELVGMITNTNDVLNEPTLEYKDKEGLKEEKITRMCFFLLYFRS